MKARETVVQETGLQFFGKLSAAVTHDLKNVLSIINEKTGLLEDFCHMAQRGMAIDMDRIGAVAVQVKGQVERADQIIRCFNRFAHGTDHPVAPTDVGESVATLVQLAQRLLSQLEVAVEVRPPETLLVMTSRPLIVQELLWAGIQWVAAHRGDKKNLSVAMERSGQGAQVSIGPMVEPPTERAQKDFLAATEAMQRVLGANIWVDRDTDMLRIQLAELQPP